MKHTRSLLLALLSLGMVTAEGTPAAPAAVRPNIILILTDDLDTRLFARMPRLESLLSDHGTTFANGFVSLSLCCPSRSSILRGQYAHNTGVYTNAPPGGGYQTFHDLGRESSTVATWLRSSGYRTVLLGKYLNGYPGTEGAGYIPPGWNEWYSLTGGAKYFDYRLNENGSLVAYGSEPKDYLTDVLSRKAKNFVRRRAAAGDGRPFFMYLAPYAPHGPATPAPRHADAFPNAQAPRTPSFNEEEVGDKPGWVQNHALLTDRQVDRLDDLARKRRQSMVAIEDMVESLIATLEDTGQLSSTYIFFTSDNGFHLGQHRLMPGKNTGFEEDLRVPLVVRGPGVPAGAVRRHLAVNIDLAPTFAELAGVAAPSFVDGRSLVPLFRTSPPPVAAWRQAFLLEHGHPDGVTTTAAGAPPVFQGLRTADRWTYIEYVDGQRELYDLSGDPAQLDNAYESADPALKERLAAWLDRLRGCAGVTCRGGEQPPQ
jgi:arylsulfatase A-like enzyme